MGEGGGGSGGELIEAARAVRAYLPELAGDPSAVDGDLVDSLVRSQAGEAVEDDLVAILSRDQRILDWVATFLEHKVPPDLVVEVERGLSSLPGHGSPVDTDRFACPDDGNFVFYRRRVGQPVPPCPDHGVALVSAP